MMEMKTRALTDNPFYILEATLRDTDKELISRAVDLRLLTGLDTSKALETLLTPSGRLDAEVGFLPRMDEEQIQDIRNCAAGGQSRKVRSESGKTEYMLPFPAPFFQPESSLALFNGVSALLTSWPVADAESGTAAALCLAGIYSIVRDDETIEELNEDRSEGKRERIGNPAEVKMKLREQKRAMLSLLCSRFDSLSDAQQDRIMERLADAYCDNHGWYYRLYALDEMVSVHMGHRNAGKAAQLVVKIRESISQYHTANARTYKIAGKKMNKAEELTEEIVRALPDELRQWDYLTKQPRRITQVKGYTREDSAAFFREVHSFFVFRHNMWRAWKKDYHLLYARSLIAAIKDVFWDLQAPEREMVEQNYIIAFAGAKRP